mmetsp:Transcript_70741/g.184454  ORF Transcript_70741/g.184454 Transcript_70741/m.184454 type:complete len:225 (+) Transcript_70741:49-723(+)
MRSMKARPRKGGRLSSHAAPLTSITWSPGRIASPGWAAFHWATGPVSPILLMVGGTWLSSTVSCQPMTFARGPEVLGTARGTTNSCARSGCQAPAESSTAAAYTSSGAAATGPGPEASTAARSSLAGRSGPRYFSKLRAMLRAGGRGGASAAGVASTSAACRGGAEIAVLGATNAISVTLMPQYMSQEALRCMQASSSALATHTSSCHSPVFMGWKLHPDGMRT